MANLCRHRGDEERALYYEEESRKIADGTKHAETENDWYAPSVVANWLYDGRNYDLFAILGNVRNGYGFAGVSTGSGFNYISSNRGLPQDVSSEIEDTLVDDFFHDVSYVTLPELLDFDWEQTTTKSGVVDINGYRQWKEQGIPENYSGGAFGPDIVNVQNIEMDILLDQGLNPNDPKRYYTVVEWKQTYRERASYFYEKSIPKLKELSTTSDYSDIRIVFGFDS